MGESTLCLFVWYLIPKSNVLLWYVVYHFQIPDYRCSKYFPNEIITNLKFCYWDNKARLCGESSSVATWYQSQAPLQCFLGLFKIVPFKMSGL